MNPRTKRALFPIRVGAELRSGNGDIIGRVRGTYDTRRPWAPRLVPARVKVFWGQKKNIKGKAHVLCFQVALTGQHGKYRGVTGWAREKDLIGKPSRARIFQKSFKCSHKCASRLRGYLRKARIDHLEGSHKRRLLRDFAEENLTAVKQLIFGAGHPDLPDAELWELKLVDNDPPEKSENFSDGLLGHYLTRYFAETTGAGTHAKQAHVNLLQNACDPNGVRAHIGVASDVYFPGDPDVRFYPAKLKQGKRSKVYTESSSSAPDFKHHIQHRFVLSLAPIRLSSHYARVQLVQTTGGNLKVAPADAAEFMQHAKTHQVGGHRVARIKIFSVNGSLSPRSVWLLDNGDVYEDKRLERSLRLAKVKKYAKAVVGSVFNSAAGVWIAEYPYTRPSQYKFPFVYGRVVSQNGSCYGWIAGWMLSPPILGKSMKEATLASSP